MISNRVWRKLTEKLSSFFLDLSTCFQMIVNSSIPSCPASSFHVWDEQYFRFIVLYLIWTLFIVIIVITISKSFKSFFTNSSGYNILFTGLTNQSSTCCSNFILIKVVKYAGQRWTLSGSIALNVIFFLINMYFRLYFTDFIALWGSYSE